MAAGALVPQVLATFRSSLDHQKRVLAFGIYGAVAGLAAAAGVVLGGVLTQYSVFGLGWRAIFFVNVPVALGVLLCAPLIPESRTNERHRLDPAPMVLVSVSLAAIVYPLLEGRRTAGRRGFTRCSLPGSSALAPRCSSTAAPSPDVSLSCM